MNPKLVYISFQDLARIAPGAGLWCEYTQKGDTFLDKIAFDVEHADAADAYEKVDAALGDRYDAEKAERGGA